MTDDPIGDALRREFASTFVPYHAASADDMLAAVHAAPAEGARWVAPMAAAAVVAVLGGGAAVIGFHGSNGAAPAGGPGPASPSSSCEVSVVTGYAYPVTASDLPLRDSTPPYTASDLPSASASASSNLPSSSPASSYLPPPPPDTGSATSEPAPSDTSDPGANESATAYPATVSALPAPDQIGCGTLPPAVASCVPVPSPTAAANGSFWYACGEQGYAPLPTGGATLPTGRASDDPTPAGPSPTTSPTR